MLENICILYAYYIIIHYILPVGTIQDHAGTNLSYRQPLKSTRQGVPKYYSCIYYNKKFSLATYFHWCATGHF